MNTLPMSELILFASCFISVFALGFQSLNVNGGHYAAAFMTSFVNRLEAIVRTGGQQCQLTF